MEDICIHRLRLGQVIFYGEADFFFSFLLWVGIRNESYEVYFRRQMILLSSNNLLLQVG